MSNIIFELVGLICLSTLSVNATPVLWIRHKLGIYQMDDDNSFLKNKLIELLSCPMCLGFWIGFGFLITSYSLFDTILLASIISIFSELLNKLLRM